MPFHGEAKQQMADWETRRKARARGEGPLMDSRFGVRTLGAVAEAAVGCSVWTDIEKRRDAHDDALGGIVLEVIDGVRRLDEETGEIILVRAFRCFDPVARWDTAFRTVNEHLISADGVEATPPYGLAKTVRRFCQEVANGRGLLVGRDAQLVVDAARLAAILMGGR